MICPKCASIHTKRDGRKKTKKGTVQEYKCHACSSYFRTPLDTTIKQYDQLIEPGKIFSFESKHTTRVHCLTDVHVGANEFDSLKFQEAINKIKDDKNAVWFGNGDLLELIPPNYKISQRGQNIPPDEQYLAFLELVAPIKDKCLFIRGGNHDYLRSFGILDFDVCRTLANELKVPYFQFPGYARIRIKGKDWYIASGHGKGGGKNGDLELDKLATVYSDGDVFVLGHNHQLYAKPIDSISVDGEEETLKRKWYFRGGSFLRYADYARYSFYPIQRTGWITMEFSEKEIKCWEN